MATVVELTVMVGCMRCKSAPTMGADLAFKAGGRRRCGDSLCVRMCTAIKWRMEMKLDEGLKAKNDIGLVS